MATFRVDKDNKGEWRWIFVAGNGKTIAMSSEGYTYRTDCLHSIKLIKEDSPSALVFDWSKNPVERIDILP